MAGRTEGDLNDDLQSAPADDSTPLSPTDRRRIDVLENWRIGVDLKMIDLHTSQGELKDQIKLGFERLEAQLVRVLDDQKTWAVVRSVGVWLWRVGIVIAAAGWAVFLFFAERGEHK